MKKLSLLTFALLAPLFVMAQGIVKGDMNNDNAVTVGDVTSVVKTALGQEPLQYVADPTKPNTTVLAGTWRTTEGAQIVLNTDGTTSNSECEAAKTYEYFPYRGLILFFDKDEIVVKAYDLLKQNDSYLLLCPKGTSDYIYYFAGSTFIGGIELDQTTLALNAGDNATLTPTITPATALVKNLNWETSDAQVATVEDGKVVAVGGGTCTITVSSTDGTNIKATCTVTVTQLVSSISLDVTSLKLNPEGTATLTATVAPENASNKNVTWKSSNTEVATVNKTTGVVTAVAIGTCKITCTAADGSGVKATCNVTVEERVPIRVTEITLSQISINMNPEGTSQLSVTSILPDNADDKTVVWSTSDAKIATVSETGLVTAVGVGTCTITCAATDGSATKADCEVSVAERVPVKVSEITLNQNGIVLPLEGTCQIEATVSPEDADVQDVEWSSSDEAIATVDENGLVTAIAAGTCTITCAATDGSEVKATCEVTVDDSNDPVLVTAITLSKKSLILDLKGTDQLAATVTPSNADVTTVTWTSDKPSIATVDSKGRVAAAGIGTCTITCAATDGSEVKATCSVTVRAVLNGHEVVDLGIVDSSGKPIYWATSNVGATSPQLYGNYYAWGETEGKTQYDWTTYQYCKDGSKTSLTKYCTSSTYGLPDGRDTMISSDDPATVAWGEGWRTPTDDELGYLRTQCKWRWVTSYNGIQVNGYTVTGKKDGYTDKTIFIPAAGYYEGTERKSAGTIGVYWSSSMYSSGYNYYSYCISADVSTWAKNRMNRCNGLTIRAVCQ